MYHLRVCTGQTPNTVDPSSRAMDQSTHSALLGGMFLLITQDLLIMMSILIPVENQARLLVKSCHLCGINKMVINILNNKIVEVVVHDSD